MTYEAVEKSFLFIPRRFFFISLFLHLLIFLSLILMESKNITHKKTFIKNVYEEYIQVDMIGLPDVLLKDLPSIDPTIPIDSKRDESIIPEPSANTKKKNASEPLRKDKAVEEALRKKALSDLSLEKAREDAIKSLTKSSRGRVALKGNILSKGTSTRGKIGTAKEAYEALIVERIKKHFDVYPWHKKKNLMAIIFIRINKIGMVIEKRLDTPSSDALFDSSVFSAIDASQPFPMPEDFSIVENGIRIEFHPED